MNTTIQEVVKLADVDKFLTETNTSDTYGECHNALTWLAVQIKRSHIPEYTIWLCSGSFARYDHSWIQVENIDDGSQTIIDMTVDQFGKFPVPYVGPVSPGYVIYNSVLLSDECALPEFIESLG